jgi:LysM repeat protein
MKPKNTIVLVIIAHIGLFLIWMCMGGCSLNRGGTTVEEIRPSDVTIPGPEDERISLDTTETVTEEAIVRSTDIERPTVIREESRATAYDPETEFKYVVKSGDSLWKISRQFKVSEAEIIDRNAIEDPAMIRIGRELYIPKRAGVEASEEEPVVTREIEEEVTTATETTTETMTTTETAVTGTEVTELDESQYVIHTVVAGDTVWKLARTYGVTTDDIIQANDIKDPKRIQIGQRLLIPKK